MGIRTIRNIIRSIINRLFIVIININIFHNNLSFR